MGKSRLQLFAGFIRVSDDVEFNVTRSWTTTESTRPAAL